MTHFAIEPDGRHLLSFTIVTYMSRVRIGPDFLKALGADPAMELSGISLEDAQVKRLELEGLMTAKVASWQRKK